MKILKIVCLVAALVLVRAAVAGAQTSFLAWDEDPNALPYVTGYAMTVDGVRTDYGLSPAGMSLACGCSIPLPFIGGFHTVVVTAYDGVNEASSAALVVGPSADAGGPYVGTAGVAITVNGSGSDAPTGWITKYTWHWGDGTIDTISPSPTASHTYDSPGIFSVTLTTTDNSDAEVSSTIQTTIVSTPPPEPARDVVVYASDIPATGLHGSWSFESDETSPAGTKLITPDLGKRVWSPSQLLTQPDYVDIEFTAAADTPYTVWLRMRATGDSIDNSLLWVQFSEALANAMPAYAIGTPSALRVNLATDASGNNLHGWGWRNTAFWWPNQATTVTFATSGAHTMRIHMGKDGVQFDQIVLSPSRYLAVAPGPPTNDATILQR